MKNIIAILLLGTIIYAGSCSHAKPQCKKDIKKMKKNGTGWQH